MKITFKILGILTGILFLVVGSYFTFIYLFTKEPKPIEVYTFSMSFEELEKRISKEIKNGSSIKKNNDSLFNTRYITLGKDSAKYFFITNLDKDKSNEYGKPWIEFQAVVDSNSKMINLYYENRDKYPNQLTLFEDEFIAKLRK